MRHTLNRIARHGMKMYHTARHYKAMADHAVHNAAHLYSHAIQPGLRQAGIDTREADKISKTATIITPCIQTPSTQASMSRMASLPISVAGVFPTDNINE